MGESVVPSRFAPQPAALPARQGSGARLVRKLLPWAVLVPLTTLVLSWAGAAGGLFSVRTGAVLLTALDVLALAGLMKFLARRFDAEAGALREAAEAANQRLAAIVVESAPIAMLMTDRQLKIVLVNRKTQELFGYSRQELVGRDLALLVPAGIRPDLPEAADFSLDPEAFFVGGGGGLFGRHQDGTEIPVEVGLNYLETAGAFYVIAAIADITQQMKARDELRRSNAELEQFAYVASHDLQEPLRMVASYTELLAQRFAGKLDEKGDKYIHYASDGAKRMQQLVSDLLAYSRVGLQGKSFVPVDSGLTLRRVLEGLGRQLREAGATVEPAEMPRVMADPTQLHQLFQNLISNGIKFRRAEAAPRIAIRAAEQGQLWEFAVEDNGIGIDPQYRDRIFQMFQRLHARGQFSGNGIGLAIVKRIVERHGGTIRLDSEIGRGTTFYFTLPKAPAAQKGKTP